MTVCYFPSVRLRILLNNRKKSHQERRNVGKKRKMLKVKMLKLNRKSQQVIRSLQRLRSFKYLFAIPKTFGSVRTIKHLWD